MGFRGRSVNYFPLRSRLFPGHRPGGALLAAATDSFEAGLAQAQLPAHRRRPEHQALLPAAFRFRQGQGTAYYSTRVLGPFLLHGGTGLKGATVARLLGISRPAASRQRALSAKQASQQAHHRLDGRPAGQRLPRAAGPIAAVLCTHPDATRADLIDFVSDTFAVGVSRIALYKSLKNYGLDQVRGPATPTPATPPPAGGTGCPPATSVAAEPAAPPLCAGGRSPRGPS